MKKLIFVFIFFFLYINSYSQSTTFNKVKYYNGDSLSNMVMIHGLLVYDSTYIIVTRGDYNNMLDGTQIFRTDLYGNVLDSLRFNHDSIMYPVDPSNCIVKDENNNIIIATNRLYNTVENAGVWEGYLIKLNSDLDTIWTRVLHLDSSLVGNCTTQSINVFTAIEITHDGGYIIMGNYYKDCIFDTQHKFPYLCKYDSNGNLLWMKLFENMGACFDIAECSDGGFAFSTSFHGTNNIEYVKTDSSGNILWAIQPDSNYHLQCNDNIIFGDEIISVSPYAYKNHTDPYSVLYGLEIVKANSNTGQKVWNKNYLPLITVENSIFWSHLAIEVDIHGNVYIAATGRAYNPDSTNGAYVGFLMKLNSAGDSIWNHFYGWGNVFNTEAQINDIVLTDDGGALLGGFWIPTGISYRPGAWLVKVDSLGNAPQMFTVDIKENKLNIKQYDINIYPNPATENVYINSQKAINKDVLLQIYNISGSLVYEELLYNFENEKSINIQNLVAGTYIVRLIEEGVEVYSTKVVKK